MRTFLAEALLLVYAAAAVYVLALVLWAAGP